MAKLWFMDVDGVMAPFRKGGAFLDWVRSPHDKYELWLSPTQADLITEVLETTGTELIWVSTWADEAGEYVDDFLGWPRHRFAPMPDPDLKGGSVGARGRWWKLDAVDELVSELQPERVVWSDDDHPRHRTSVNRWLETADADVLIQAPKSHVGLSRRWIREAWMHLDRRSGRLLTGPADAEEVVADPEDSPPLLDPHRGAGFGGDRT